MRRASVALVGDCKGTSNKLDATVLKELETFKIRAMRQAGVRFARGGPTVALFSKAGFKTSLMEAVAERDDIVLVDPQRLVDDLVAAG